MEFLSHFWSAHDFAVPAMDLTNFVVKDQHSVTIRRERKRVKFASYKHLVESWGIPACNLGYSVVNRINSGSPVTTFSTTGAEFASAYAMARA